jgi:ATP-dependent Lon protease
MPASRWSSNPVELFDWVGEEDSQLMDLLLPNIFTRLAQKNVEGKPGEQSGTDEMSKIPDIIPILPLRGVVVFPQTAVPLTIGQPRSIKLVDDVVVGDKIIGLIASRNPDLENPGPEDLYRIGSLAVVQRLLRAPDGTIRLLVQGLERIRIGEFVQTEPYLTARVEKAQEIVETGLEVDALARNARDQFETIAN